MKLILSNLVLLTLFLGSCKTTSQTFTASTPIEQLAVELFEVIKKKDFNAFEKLMAKDMKIEKHQRATDDYTNSNTETTRKIFDSFYEKNIDWKNVKIKKVSSSMRGTEILKHAQVTINFNNKTNSCTLFFPNWLKPENESWKIGGLPPELNCLSK